MRSKADAKVGQMKRSGNRGFTIIEMVIAAAVAGVLTTIVILVIKTSSKSSQSLAFRGDSQTEMYQLAQHIMTVGRLSYGCAATKEALECDVDYSVPPTGKLTKVQFSFSKTQGTLSDLLFKEFVGGSPTIKRKYKYIEKIEFCDDAIMKKGQCSIEPVELSARHSQNLGSASPGPAKATADGTFFRFRITGISGQERELKKDITKGTKMHLQSAFYVRNKDQTVSSLVYRWGTLE